METNASQKAINEDLILELVEISKKPLWTRPVVIKLDISRTELGSIGLHTDGIFTS